MTTCSWSETSWLFGEEKCEEAATVTVILGCVHEHLSENPTCGDCLPVVRRTVETGHGLCTPCRDGGTDYVPVVIVSVEPIPDPSTPVRDTPSTPVSNLPHGAE